eukprot:3940974-Rhodomonas_salina.3
MQHDEGRGPAQAAHRQRFMQGMQMKLLLASLHTTHSLQLSTSTDTLTLPFPCSALSSVFVSSSSLFLLLPPSSFLHYTCFSSSSLLVLLQSLLYPCCSLPSSSGPSF